MVISALSSRDTTPSAAPSRTSRPGAVDRAFWRGRRVLVTGHTGFKGSWLVLWLEALGADVTGYALAAPTHPNLFEQARVDRGVRSVVGDVRDLNRLAGVVADSRPEVVMHLAAQSVVKHGFEDPVETFSTNVMGTVNLLQALRRTTTRCAVVNVTSDKCYANHESDVPHREDGAMGGDDPYSASKGCAELVTTAFRHSFFAPGRLGEHGIALASARAGNAIGGGDWTPHQLIPDLVRAFAAGSACAIRHPEAIRPWQFVLEPLRGYLMLAERLAGDDAAAFAEGWNFGPAQTDAQTVEWVANQLVREWGSRAAWVRDGTVHPAENPVLRLDATKAAARLGWLPALPLHRTIEWIVEWYRAWSAGDDLARLTRDQIERYERLGLPEPGGVLA
jgi:CDP-glucose 4,6-dehydratase